MLGQSTEIAQDSDSTRSFSRVRELGVGNGMRVKCKFKCLCGHRIVCEGGRCRSVSPCCLPPLWPCSKRVARWTVGSKLVISVTKPSSDRILTMIGSISITTFGWVFFSFAQPFSCFSHVLFRKLVLKHHVLFVSRQHFYIDRLFSLPIVFCYPSFESFSPFSCCVAESRDVFFPFSPNHVASTSSGRLSKLCVSYFHR